MYLYKEVDNMGFIGNIGRAIGGGTIGGGVRRAAVGGAVGAGLAWANDSSMLGGAVGGLASPIARRMLANRFGSISGLAGRGAGALGRGSNWLYRRGFGMMGGGKLASNVGVGMSMAGSLGARGAGALGGAIGRNSVAINKYGGRALMGLGVASGAYIGSSILGSNRGY
jgi:hypothetical protein